jgi:hypothetical protein
VPQRKTILEVEIEIHFQNQSLRIQASFQAGPAETPLQPVA